MDRVLASEARGCGFDPRRAHQTHERFGNDVLTGTKTQAGADDARSRNTSVTEVGAANVATKLGYKHVIEPMPTAIFWLQLRIGGAQCFAQCRPISW